jgi:hypothetical protein
MTREVPGRTLTPKRFYFDNVGAKASENFPTVFPKLICELNHPNTV